MQWFVFLYMSESVHHYSLHRDCKIQREKKRDQRGSVMQPERGFYSSIFTPASDVAERVTNLFVSSLKKPSHMYPYISIHTHILAVGEQQELL